MAYLEKVVLSKAMKVMGFIALIAAVLAIKPSSTMMSQQPKCPDEFME